MDNKNIYFDLPIIFTKQKGYGQSLLGKIKPGSIVELPPDAVLVFPREITELRTDLKVNV